MSDARSQEHWLALRHRRVQQLQRWMDAVAFAESHPDRYNLRDVVVRCGCKRGQRGLMHIHAAAGLWRLSIAGLESPSGRLVVAMQQGVAPDLAFAAMDNDQPYANLRRRWRCRGCGVTHDVATQRLDTAAFLAGGTTSRRPWITVTSTGAPWARGEADRLTWTGGGRD